MTELIQPPSDLLRYVFNRPTLQSWRAVQNPSTELRFRLQVAEASGPLPSAHKLARDLRHYRAHKNAWHAYLFTAFACRMFEGNRGNELLGRLRSPISEQFRSAMAECMVCWYLAKRKLAIDTWAPGRGAKVLEMKIVASGDEIGVEVKAPYEDIPEYQPGQTTVKNVDDSQKLAPCMVAANKQFDDKTPNLLALVPRLERSIVQARDELLQAAFGRSKLTSTFDPGSGTLEEPNLEFDPDGKLLQTRLSRGKSIKPDGLPAHRRISAILCLEERVVQKHSFPNPFILLERPNLVESWKAASERHNSADNDVWVEHDAILVHNPHAYHVMPQEMWADTPQLLPDGNTMKWSDGHPINV